MNREHETSLSASPKNSRVIGNVTTNITIGTLVMTIIAWILVTYFNVDLPSEVALAIASLINILIGYVTKSDMRGRV